MANHSMTSHFQNPCIYGGTQCAPPPRFLDLLKQAGANRVKVVSLHLVISLFQLIMHKQLCGDDSVRLSFDSELKLELWSGKLDAGLPVAEDVAEPGVAGAGRHSARWRDHSRARPSGDFDFTLFEKKVFSLIL